MMVIIMCIIMIIMYIYIITMNTILTFCPHSKHRDSSSLVSSSSTLLASILRNKGCVRVSEVAGTLSVLVAMFRTLYSIGWSRALQEGCSCLIKSSFSYNCQRVKIFFINRLSGRNRLN